MPTQGLRTRPRFASIPCLWVKGELAMQRAHTASPTNGVPRRHMDATVTHGIARPSHSFRRPSLWVPPCRLCCLLWVQFCYYRRTYSWHAQQRAKPGLTQADESARETGLSRFCGTPEKKRRCFRLRPPTKGQFLLADSRGQSLCWLCASRPAVIAELHPLLCSYPVMPGQDRPQRARCAQLFHSSSE